LEEHNIPDKGDDDRDMDKEFERTSTLVNDNSTMTRRYPNPNPRAYKPKKAEDFTPRPCVQFMRTKSCDRGDNCPFSHVRPAPICDEWRQDGKCSKNSASSPCKFAHPESFKKKAEQLQPGKPVIRDVFKLEIHSYDRTGNMARCNAHITRDTIIVPRHCCAGRVKVCAVIDNKEVDLGPIAYVSKTMPDQCWFRKANNSIKNNTGCTYREPVIGESVLLSWLENSVSVMTAGVVQSVEMMGSDRKIKAYSYSGSTKSGTCGAVYISLVDGALVGFHGVGSESVKVLPQFFGCNAGWDHELKAWANSDATKFSEDEKYGNGNDEGAWSKCLNNAGPNPLNL
jgi:hypothetical protein